MEPQPTNGVRVLAAHLTLEILGRELPNVPCLKAKRAINVVADETLPGALGAYLINGPEIKANQIVIRDNLSVREVVHVMIHEACHLIETEHLGKPLYEAGDSHDTKWFQMARAMIAKALRIDDLIHEPDKSWPLDTLTVCPSVAVDAIVHTVESVILWKEQKAAA